MHEAYSSSLIFILRCEKITLILMSVFDRLNIYFKKIIAYELLSFGFS